MDQAAGIRILIADDHAMFRKGLHSLLTAETGFTVIGEGECGEDAVRLARALRPDILLLDMAMPGLSGLEALTELAAAPIPVRTILLTASIEKPDVVKALKLGAAGVVLKTSQPAELFKCIRGVMTGQHWIGREAVSDLVEALRTLDEEAVSTRPRFGLTPRELEVTSAVVSGFSNKEIAKKLVLSEDTVKHHLTNIFDKVGASNRLELALFAVHHRLLEGQDSTGR
jgi:two-component system, NarL family, nitrate/nitrite response regulator NarL